MAHIYNLETGAWIQDPADGWVSSKVVSKNIEGDRATLVFQITSGSREGAVRFSCQRGKAALTRHLNRK